MEAEEGGIVGVPRLGGEGDSGGVSRCLLAGRAASGNAAEASRLEDCSGGEGEESCGRVSSASGSEYFASRFGERIIEADMRERTSSSSVGI